jgi:hypothetical protein
MARKRGKLTGAAKVEFLARMAKGRRAPKRAHKKNPIVSHTYSGFVIHAYKGEGPLMHFDGSKFTTNGGALLFKNKIDAEIMRMKLLTQYPILRRYRVTVEPTAPK